MGITIKCFLVGMGIIIIIKTVVYRAKNEMDPTFSVTWCLFSLGLMILGLGLNLGVIQRYMSWEAVLLLLLSFAGAVGSFYVISLKLSDLLSRNRELAMLMSIIYHEGEDGPKPGGGEGKAEGLPGIHERS